MLISIEGITWGEGSFELGNLTYCWLKSFYLLLLVLRQRKTNGERRCFSLDALPLPSWWSPVPWLDITLSSFSKATSSSGDWDQHIVLAVFSCSLFLSLLLYCGFPHWIQCPLELRLLLRLILSAPAWATVLFWRFFYPAVTPLLSCAGIVFSYFFFFPPPSINIVFFP